MWTIDLIWRISMLKRQNNSKNDEYVTMYDNEMDDFIAQSTAGGGSGYIPPLTGSTGSDHSNGWLIIEALFGP